MSVTPNNFLQSVATYQAGHLAYLQNKNCFIGTANKEYMNFQNTVGNLGQQINFQLPYRFTASNSLIAQIEPITQRLESIVVDHEASVGTAYNSEEEIFNLNEKEYFNRIGRSAMAELGQNIEDYVASTILENTYRFYGNGISPINSFGQLADMLARFDDYGSAPFSKKGYLDLISIPSIVNSGLGQFVPGRNENMAVNWMVGNFQDCEWYKTNSLPTHTAGTVGNTNKTSSPILLTVVSTNDATGNAITQITCSGAAVSDPLAIMKNDLMYFVDGVSGQPDMRYLKFVGHTPISNQVQIRATASAGSDSSGNVVINISPTLQSTFGQNQNIRYNIAAGMKISVIPTHRRGLLVSGDSLYLAMPRLGNQNPYYTSSVTDDQSGASIRMTMGSRGPGLNLNLIVYDAIVGRKLVAENAMGIIFPV